MLRLRYAFVRASRPQQDSSAPTHQENAFCNVSVSSWVVGQVLQSSTDHQMAINSGFNYVPAQSTELKFICIICDLNV